MSAPVIDLPEGSYEAFARVYDAAGFDRFALSLAGRVEEMIRRTGARRLVDLACGTGSLLIRLAPRVLFAAGLDRSPAMIARARAKGAARTAVGSMERAPFRPRLDLALCLYDSLNYCAGEEDLRRALGGIRRAVRPGGCLLFDLNTEEAYRAVWGGGDAFRARTPEGNLVIRSSYDRFAGIARAEVDVDTRDGGKRSILRSVHRQYFHPEGRVEEALRRAGWEEEARETIDPFPGGDASLPGGKTLWTARAAAPPEGEREEA
ncbi:MAG: methyltransferase domain-containing protein [Candidatus Eisenbacteria bacterium]|nr:methyltransferase domain-containing protein [Candidatus Eisenbacteria bacterium]